MALAAPTITPEQYLARERAAAERHEYVNGQVFAMSGATRRHNLIAGNVFAELRAQLRGRPGEVYMVDLRVKVEATGLYTYPDVVALCGEPGFADEALDTLLNPAMIVEVLSASTEAYDRGEKFAHYRRLESLTDYVLIAQDQRRVEHYARQGAQWVLTELTGTTDRLKLHSLGCQLPLGEIYERVGLLPASSSPETP